MLPLHPYVTVQKTNVIANRHITSLRIPTCRDEAICCLSDICLFRIQIASLHFIPLAMTSREKTSLRGRIPTIVGRLTKQSVVLVNLSQISGIIGKIFSLNSSLSLLLKRGGRDSLQCAFEPSQGKGVWG